MTNLSERFPLLLFPEATSTEREKLRSAQTSGSFRRPSAEEQGERLAGRWAALQSAMQQQTAALATTISGVDPELVLVFEIANSVEDFANAVARIPGFEFLAEIDEEAIDDAEQVFGVASESSAATVPGTLYLMATNQQALAAVLDLWHLYVSDRDARFPHGQGRWKYVFEHLLDVRRWSARDRIRGTGVEQDFAERVALGQEVVPAELELWYRSDEHRRAAAEAAVRSMVDSVGGSVVAAADIEGIAYHAVLARLPIEQVLPVLEGSPDEVALLRVEDLAFVRPQSIVVAPLPDPGQESASQSMSFAPPSGAPLVAVLDGVPLAGHNMLSAHLQIDDPEALEAEAQTSQRVHGTGVCGLVVHGDASDASTPLSHPVHVRPILVPDAFFDGRAVERIPDDVLPIDLIHRAFVRMFDGEGQTGATARSIRAINLSVGDSSNPLATALSPWARLLDWLAHRYGVLVIVSAGNHSDPLMYPYSAAELSALPVRQRRIATLSFLSSVAHQRRLLSPSEAMNALTVGATHDDTAVFSGPLGSRIDPLPGAAAGVEAPPSPISAIGMGYRQSIKPDLLAPGGRVFYQPEPASQNARPSVLRVQRSPSALPPGLWVAAPGMPGVLNNRSYWHGTSGAAALATHSAGLILEELLELRDPAGRGVPPEHLGVLTKTLLVHSARIPNSAQELRDAIAESVQPWKMRSAISRYYGYGILNTPRVQAGEATRVTLLGSGSVLPDGGYKYAVPLPQSLAGTVVQRRLTITLASLVPIRPKDHRHRASEVYFIPETGALQLRRVDADWTAVRHGAVQHEVLEGVRAVTFLPEDELIVHVSCRSIGGSHREPSLYGLAVTLEVGSDSGLPIYAEVEARVRQTVLARARVRGG